uniref:Transmembrane protein n=1 Tax=Medicago truncatula TaxID=3880 RepID=Q2HW61_MEDTR|nr:hypothetical protein MtrDRAFT_AC147961g9v2 [Medicago truncatula]
MFKEPLQGYLNQTSRCYEHLPRGEGCVASNPPNARFESFWIGPMEMGLYIPSLGPEHIGKGMGMGSSKTTVVAQYVQLLVPDQRQQPTRAYIQSYVSSSPRPSASSPSAVPKHHYYDFPDGKDDFNKPHHSHQVLTAVIIVVAVVFLLVILYIVIRKVVKKFSDVPNQGADGFELGGLPQQEEREDPCPSSPASP